MGANLSPDASLSRYIDRVRSVPRLSREEEHALAVRMRAGDSAAAHALVEANLRFVVAIALQYRRYGIPVWELIAEGSLGLMMAVRKFDPERFDLDATNKAITRAIRRSRGNYRFRHEA